MRFLDKRISDAYYQIYIILDPKEKNNIINKVKLSLLEIQKNQFKEQISIHKALSINAKTTKSIDKYNELLKQYDEMSIDNIMYNSKEVEDGICNEIIQDVFEHIESLNIIQVFHHESSIIGSFDDTNPLTIIYSFCYISKDYDLKLPKSKGNVYLFTSKDIDMIQTEIMLYNKYYKVHKVLFSTEFSDLQFSYIKDDDIQLNLYMDISEIENKFEIDRNLLVGLERKQYLLKNIYGQECLINIKEIYDKIVFDIDDEIVKKINYLNTKTVKEFRKKIEEVFSHIYNINSNVSSILQNIIKINDLNIDNYVIKFYSKLLNINNIEEDNYIMENLKLSFVTSYLLCKNNIDISNYFFYMEQEYKMLYQIKYRSEETSLEEYMNMKAPYYSLYEYFRLNNLVTERSYNE